MISLNWLLTILGDDIIMVAKRNHYGVRYAFYYGQEYSSRGV
jgi:hypothetical protein